MKWVRLGCVAALIISFIFVCQKPGAILIDCFFVSVRGPVSVRPRRSCNRDYSKTTPIMRRQNARFGRLMIRHVPDVIRKSRWCVFLLKESRPLCQERGRALGLGIIFSFTMLLLQLIPFSFSFSLINLVWSEFLG